MAAAAVEAKVDAAALWDQLGVVKQPDEAEDAEMKDEEEAADGAGTASLGEPMLR